MLEHILTVAGGGVVQEFEIASEADETLDLVRTLFENAQEGKIVEIPVRVAGSTVPGRLILNTSNLASAVVSQREIARHG